MLGRLPDPALTAAFSTREAHQTHSSGPASSTHSMQTQWPTARSRSDQHDRHGDYARNTATQSDRPRASRGYTSASSSSLSLSRQSNYNRPVSRPGQMHEGLDPAVQLRRNHLEEQRKSKWQPGEPPLIARRPRSACSNSALRCSCAYCNIG